jgi:hypothetical protein
MNKWLCWMFGHQYYVIQEFESWSRRIGCLRCGQTWGMNDHVQALLPWDKELEELYELLGFRILKI